METSPWRQRKSSSAKMESASDMLHGSSRRIKGKARMVPPASGVKPERARKSLNEKLATIVLDSHTKDRRMSVCGEKGAEEILKDELDEDLGNTEIGANRELSPSHVASDELLKQLESLIKDHGRTARDSNDDVTVESKNERKHPEDDLIEMKRRLESLATENHRLRNSLEVKEKLVKTLHDRKYQLESEFEALMGRLDSTEKENAFLRYEYHVLEKDLEVRTEEMEYARRSIDLAHKQQLKSVNKIVELEAECQRLRLLIRKKFPGTSILLQPKLRSEAEERKMEIRRNANMRNDFSMRDEFQNQKLHHDLLMEQLGNVREENKNLKEMMILKRNTEIKELSRGQKQKPANLAKNNKSPVFHECSPVASCDIGSEGGVRSSGSLSKAIVSQPRDENFKKLREQRITRTSEMILYMEDFTEMEKFAIVSTDKNSRDGEDHQPFDWVQVVLSAISKQQRISKRSARELLEDIKIALGCMDASTDTKKPEGESVPLCITWKSPESGSMTKEEIKKHLGLNTAKLVADEDVVAESLDSQKVSIETESGKQDLQEENKNLKDEIKKIDSESKELRLKLEESEEKIRSLETEMKTLKESKDTVEAQMETEKSINEDLDTQLSVTRAKLNETQQKLSSLEVELDFRKSCCEELEGTCLELQLQLESVEKKEPPKYLMEKNRKQSQNGWDVAAASIKLAECQETIINLRKQLKALALPSNFSALSSETSNITKFSSKGSSLRDQMIFEDDAKKPQNNNTVPHHDNDNDDNDDGDDDDDDDDDKCNALIVYTPRVYSITKDEEKKDGFTTMAMVQSHKKQGLGFLKKLLFRRRRGTSKKSLALTM